MNKLSLPEVAKGLKGVSNALIFCHKSPDPDTLGSAFALECILKALGARVRIACSDAPNPKFDFITGGTSLTDDFCIDEYDSVIAIDVGSQPQLGGYSAYADRVTLIIDHHESSVRFADYYEDFCSACAMIVYDIARELDIIKGLPKRFFECVYAGLSGDTGCFKYSNTSKKALLIASELVETGIDFASINYSIFDCKSVGEIVAQRVTYENMMLLEGGSLALVLITNKMKKEHGITDDDISDIVNSLRQIKGVLVAVSIKQNSSDESKFSISSRANVDIDVSALCAELGGGGHPRASGATVTGVSESEALEIVRELFLKGVRGYGKRA